MKKYLLGLLSVLLLSNTAAADSFVVKDIQIRGVERVSASTVQSYLKVKRGQVFSSSASDETVRALYKTGFFESVNVSRNGNTLVIQVSERPTIGRLKVTGNSVIPTDKLMDAMKSLEIAEGRIYDRAMIERVKQSLVHQYYQLGRYNARVELKTTPMPRNRVAVTIEVSEGLVAKVKRVSIIGNHDFSESTLLKQLDVTSSGFITWITQSDRFQEDKLESSLEKLRSFYLDRGYVRFQIKSSQSQVTPDKKLVFITIAVNEGSVYRLGSYDVKGQLLFPKSAYLEVMKLHVGDVFSRQSIINAQKAIIKLLGDKGYLFASVGIDPVLDETKKTVALSFDIKPGKRTYVRKIGFTDNTRTNDAVLRREMLQMEAAPASMTKIEESKHRLLLQPFIKDATLSVNPVPGTDDKVDIDYAVKEDNSAQANIRFGYSQAFGLILGAGFNQKNIFGTGNTLGLNASRSRFEQVLSADFTDPYFTADGVSRSFHFAISRFDPGAAKNLNNAYTANDYTAGVLFGVPVGQEESVINTLQAGLYYQNTMIHISNSGNNLSNQVAAFTSSNGRHFQEADIRLAFTRNSLDKTIFPTKGAWQSVVLDTYLPLAKSSLRYYTLSYNLKSYVPLNDSFIVASRLDLGYGNGFQGIGGFPYFKHFYAGGIDSVRGYETYNLGPRDSNGNGYGGNKLIDASVGLIFPNYISDSVRTMAYMDAGNVYLSENNRKYGGNSTNSGPVRYAVGVEADWLIPSFGPIRLSLAKPVFDRNDGVRKEAFQFALGASF